MNWHAPTTSEISGEGSYGFLIDIQPDIVPHQAASDGDALLRLSKPGWSWIIRDMRKQNKKNPRPCVHLGKTDTKEAAIGQVQAELARIRAKYPE